MQMRSTFLVVTLIVLFASAVARAEQSAALPEEMEEQGGLVHRIGEAAPYTGIVQDLHQSGKPRLRAEYNAGKLVSSKLWYESGQVAEEVSIQGDTWTIRRYGETGHMEEETVAVFSGGRKTSEHIKRWDENGKLITEAGFRQGKLDGPLKEYDASGALVRDEIYDKGKLVKKIK